jgi:hypothetical protein
MSAYTGHNPVGVNLVIVRDILNYLGNYIQFHDLPVDDRVVGQILVSEGDQIKIVYLAVQFDHFDRARTDIQAGNAFLFTEAHYFLLLLAFMPNFFLFFTGLPQFILTIQGLSFFEDYLPPSERRGRAGHILDRLN